MKKPTVWNPVPALVGLGALVIYILACTSFSPDDSKVLYLTVDAQTGMTGVAVYDRKAGKTELLFQPISQNLANLPSAKPAVMRPQWLEGGHNILAAWVTDPDDKDKSLNLAVLPFDRRGTARTFLLSDLGDDGSTRFFYWPLPVVGSSVFLSGVSNSIIRLNLETGEMQRQTNQQELVLLPSPDNDRLFYLGGDSNSPSECGSMDPATFARTPLFQIKAKKLSVISLALSRDAKRLAYQEEDEKPPVVHLLETGQPERTIPLTSLGANTEVNLRHFSPNGDILYGSLKSSTDGTNADYGFVEIPVDSSPIRKTTLISGVNIGEDMFASFQIDISHDGQTLAVESLWFAYGEHPIKGEDCALFLVDLTDPQRKVTKVPIPLPPKDQPSPFK